jgi:hypothetical protein
VVHVAGRISADADGANHVLAVHDGHAAPEEERLGTVDELVVVIIPLLNFLG